ncbi:MAG: DUF2971 domain-containing protein [Nitrosomonas sp.]|nr:MAG: DUF2971 domain-containing protein [Nitrosomonas sp.]
MYKLNPAFTVPEDVNIKVWRYMDLSKFVAMLQSSALFFSCADRMGDKLEGSYPLGNAERRLSAYYGIKRYPGFERKLRQWTAINCWHMNNGESDAMWKLYLKSDEGLAIQSTFSRLSESFCKTKQEINIGVVKYINFAVEQIPEIHHVGHYFSPFLHKQKSFEHERELRAIIQDVPICKQMNGLLGVQENIIDMDAPGWGAGKTIPVDLKKLVETIYVCPESPE